MDYDFGTVSLRDETFAGSAGFPIFRNEPVPYVRELVKQALEQEREALPSAGLTPNITHQEQEPLAQKPLAPESLTPEPFMPEPAAAAPPEPPKAENFRITDPDLGVGGPKTKYQAIL